MLKLAKRGAEEGAASMPLKPAITLSTQQNKKVKRVQGVVLRERGKGKMVIYVRGPPAVESDPEIRTVDITLVSKSEWRETISEVTVKAGNKKMKIAVEWEDHGQGLIGMVRGVQLAQKGKNMIYEAAVSLPNWKCQGVKGGVIISPFTIVNMTAVTSPPRPGFPAQAGWAPGHITLGVSTKTVIDAALRSNCLPNMTVVAQAVPTCRQYSNRVDNIRCNLRSAPPDFVIEEYDEWVENKKFSDTLERHLIDIPEHMMQGTTGVRTLSYTPRIHSLTNLLYFLFSRALSHALFHTLSPALFYVYITPSSQALSFIHPHMRSLSYTLSQGFVLSMVRKIKGVNPERTQNFISELMGGLAGDFVEEQGERNTDGRVGREGGEGGEGRGGRGVEKRGEAQECTVQDGESKRGAEQPVHGSDGRDEGQGSWELQTQARGTNTTDGTLPRKKVGMVIYSFLSLLELGPPPISSCQCRSRHPRPHPTPPRPSPIPIDPSPLVHFDHLPAPNTPPTWGSDATAKSAEQIASNVAAADKITSGSVRL
jgi:hypothetical protein